MRRMITESEVEKLDSIKPSEIEKLGKITDADIESVQAMQSPIGATANYVLTADGKGKATYKQSQSGARISFSSGGGAGSMYKDWFTQRLSSPYNRDNFPGYVIAKVSVTSGTISVGYNGFPWYLKDDNTKVYIAPGDYFVMQGEYNDLVFGVKQSVYDQFVADTANNQNAQIYTGKYGQHTYSQN